MSDEYEFDPLQDALSGDSTLRAAEPGAELDQFLADDGLEGAVVGWTQPRDKRGRFQSYNPQQPREVSQRSLRESEWTGEG